MAQPMQLPPLVISETFANGDHNGAKVLSLVEDLLSGVVDPFADDRLELNVAQYAGALVSFNNRRLFLKTMPTNTSRHISSQATAGKVAKTMPTQSPKHPRAQKSR